VCRLREGIHVPVIRDSSGVDHFLFAIGKLRSFSGLSGSGIGLKRAGAAKSRARSAEAKFVGPLRAGPLRALASFFQELGVFRCGKDRAPREEGNEEAFRSRIVLALTSKVSALPAKKIEMDSTSICASNQGTMAVAQYQIEAQACAPVCLVGGGGVETAMILSLKNSQPLGRDLQFSNFSVWVVHHGRKHVVQAG
jgi:hypothetical protein